MAFSYRRILLIGATSGIGAAMADRFVLAGAKVIAVGRRQDRLDAFVQKHGSDKTSSIRFDITDRAGLDGFVTSIVSNYPDLDCVYLNSGVQSMVRLNQPDQVDMTAFDREIDTNFISMVHLSIKFLPYLLQKSYPTCMMYTGTHIATIPAMTVPAYSASKAATGAYFECLRRQNQDSNVKFIDILAPAVQTEIHDYMGPHGASLGMPIDEFVAEVFQGLEAGLEQIPVGAIGGVELAVQRKFIETRNTLFNNLSIILKTFL